VSFQQHRHTVNSRVCALPARSGNLTQTPCLFWFPGEAYMAESGEQELPLHPQGHLGPEASFLNLQGGGVLWGGEKVSLSPPD
jgi:hypothetical protein